MVCMLFPASAKTGVQQALHFQGAAGKVPSDLRKVRSPEQGDAEFDAGALQSYGGVSPVLMVGAQGRTGLQMKICRSGESETVRQPS